MWLSNQPNKAELCKKNDNTKAACPDTYTNKCNDQNFIKCINVRVPTSRHTINCCDDCASEFSFVYINENNEQKERNCMWLSNMQCKSELWKRFNVIRIACPDTCNNKCNVQDFRCRNSRKPTLSPMLDSGYGRLTESDKVLKPNGSGKIIKCKQDRNDQEIKCQKNWFRETCSKSCCNA